MPNKFTPGPGKVNMMSKPQLRRFYVVRPIDDGTWSSPHWEQLRNEEGAVANFETEAEARAALKLAGWE